MAGLLFAGLLLVMYLVGSELCWIYDWTIVWELYGRGH